METVASWPSVWYMSLCKKMTTTECSGSTPKRLAQTCQLKHTLLIWRPWSQTAAIFKERHWAAPETYDSLGRELSHSEPKGIHSLRLQFVCSQMRRAPCCAQPSPTSWWHSTSGPWLYTGRHAARWPFSVLQTLTKNYVCLFKRKREKKQLVNTNSIPCTCL